jgi:hypothetical protein
MRDHTRDDMQAELEPEEQAALEALLRTPELTDADWDRLHRSTSEAAERLLAQRRIASVVARRPPSRVRPVRQWPVPRWLAPALPLAAAAALLLFVTQREDAVRPHGTFGAADEMLLADVSDYEFSLLVSGHADPASLLMLAVQDEHENGS